ncbi:MAG: hypothetical protein JRD89_02150 [Deltaproteobacteria bacterium]|nr:hypothetical protein [Deltaproteobacteria bacterium]
MKIDKPPIIATIITMIIAALTKERTMLAYIIEYQQPKNSQGQNLTSKSVPTMSTSTPSTTSDNSAP